ncbi:MAG TPA: hypothetical protein VFQ85_12975 [Mycobacteriales bacterium]|nr:hypothetical protein [Mycobacteriales bacterium]
MAVEPERFSGPAAVRGVVLPARAAYLVKVGSRHGVRRAVREASSRWGGATEPIIPVRAGGKLDPLWRQMLAAANVDGLVNVDAGSAGEKLGAALGYEVVPIEHIDGWGPTASSLRPSHVEGFEQAQAPVIASSSDAPLWEAIAAGDVTEEHYAQLRELAGGSYRARPDGVARAQLRRGDTLLDRTLVQFEEHTATNLPPAAPAVVWVTSPNGVVDCVAFWNLRALRSLSFRYAPMLLLPDRDVQHWIEFREQFHFVLARPAEFTPDVLLLGANAAKRTALATLLGLTRTTAQVKFGRSMPPPPTRTAPFTYRDDVPPWRLVLNQREYGRATTTEMHVHQGQASVRITSPVTFTGPGGYVLLRIASDAFDGLPRRPVIAETVLRNATWMRDALEVRTYTLRDYNLALTQPSLPECVTRILAQRATTHPLSDKGRLGDALLRQVDPAELLAPGVTEVITALTTPRAPALERELRRAREAGLPEDDIVALAATWGGRHDRRYRGASDIGGAHAAAALERLCQLGLAERGGETKCTRCGLGHFVPLPSLGARAVCPGCFADATYTTTTAGLSVRYRLNSFVDRASDQGVIPHLLVIAALATTHPHTYLLPGVNLEFHDGHTGEIDLVGVIDGRFVAGEVKTNAFEFTQEQIDHTVDLTTRLDAEVCVLAAVDEIPATVREYAAAAATVAGLDLTILDRTELRPR